VLLGVTVDMAGFGFLFKSSVLELCNFTVLRMRASMLQTVTDMQVGLGRVRAGNTCSARSLGSCGRPSRGGIYALYSLAP
jgi:hypothetical protein